jgi:Spy/CpxP family protein refolding chaperone
MNVKQVGMALALAAMMLSLPALAQQNTPSASDQGWQGKDPCARINAGKTGKRGGRGFGRMAQQLNLTDQQKGQIKSLRDDTHSQVVGVCNDKSLSQQQKMEKIRDIRKAQHDKMMAVLTPEQQEKFKQLRQERAGKRHRHGGANTGTTTTPPSNPQ